MMRIALFLATNMGVMLIASVVFRLLGIDQMVGGGMTASLIYCAPVSYTHLTLPTNREV